MAEASLLTTPEARSVTAGPGQRVRLAYFVSHPIQYQAPLLRRIAQEPDIDLTTFFSSDLSVRGRGYKDAGFGVEVKWDIPLLDGYKYEFLPKAGDGDELGFARPLNWGILKRLEKGRFDVVWVFGYSRLASLQAIVAANLLRLPVLIRTDSQLDAPKRSAKTRAVKWVFAKFLKAGVSAVTATGIANARYWKHYFGEDFPVFTMPYAVDSELFYEAALAARPHREQLRRELQLEPDRPVILCATKLQGLKRVQDVIDAFARLSQAPGSDDRACLLIVGDGEERANLEQRAKSCGLSNVRFIGFRNQRELPALYELADIFVLSSEHDAWGLVVNEAMHAGCAVVTSSGVGCHPDLVHEGVNGFVYPTGDVEQLSLHLHRLISDLNLCSAMGQNSLKIIANYSFDQDVVGLRQALAQLVPGFRA